MSVSNETVGVNGWIRENSFHDPHSRTRNLAQEPRNWSDSTSIYDTPAANTDQHMIDGDSGKKKT